MRRIAGIGLLALLALAEQAHACAVCWGGASDSSMIDGAKMSILFMAVLIYTVLGGFIAGFVVIGRRARSVAAAGAAGHTEEEHNNPC
ncbi:MAG: hypothetical protein OEM62_03485 [Acidobacteriota bacterium]|nr:hypothetical protein [Acidobacteriota bacterium]